MKSFPPVSLRAMEPEDLDTLYTLENDRTVWGVSATNVPYSRSVLIDYITSSKSDIYADGQVRLMVDNEEGQTVGTVDLTNLTQASPGRAWNSHKERISRSGIWQVCSARNMWV